MSASRRNGIVTAIPGQLPASPHALERLINKRSRLIARLSSYDDDGTPTTPALQAAIVDAACCEVDGLTRAWIVAWHNETET